MSNGYTDAQYAKEFVLVDGNGRIAGVDSATRSLQLIDYAHHEIHTGSHFFYTDSVLLASAGTQDYLITTPDTTKWAHMIIVPDGSAITQFQLYEATDKTGTTAQTVQNRNRNSVTAAGVTVHKGVSGGSTDGTLIWQYKGGAATGVSSRSSANVTRNNSEIVLKQNTKYILRITSGTNDNLTNVMLDWYEHTNVE